MRKLVTAVIFCFMFTAANAQQSHASNIRIIVTDEQLIVMYDLSTRSDIEIHASFDGGVTFTGPLRNVAGAVGANIAPERDKVIIWSVVSELGSVDYPNAVIKIVATAVGEAPAASTETLHFVKLRGLYWRWEFITIGDGFITSTDLNRDKIRAGQLRKRMKTDPVKLLNKYEVQGIMKTNPSALQVFDKGLKQQRNAWIWFGIGTGFYAGGLALTLIALETYDPYDQSYNETLLNAGLICLVAATGCYITTIALDISGRKKIPVAVDMYNRGLPASKTNAELKFGITGNGVGMALRF